MQIRALMIKGILSFILMAYAPFLWAQATANMDMPSLDTPLNDFNPEYPIGRYIQQVSSNMVEDAVQLTNGVLTVGGESINIAEPVHVSVTTNDSGVVTNTYNAVYEDGLQKQLEEYAPKKKMVIEGGVTNYTSVAYLSDIPEDTKKADKMMLAKEYSCQPVGVVLSMVYTPEAPLSAWAWTSTESIGNYTDLTLFYTNKVWTLVTNGSTTATISGNEGQTSITFPTVGLTFTPINATNSYVVYTTQMERYTKAVLTDYISKSNLNSIAEEITEDKLHTLDGIVQTLKGIKGAINGIVGLPSLRFMIEKNKLGSSGSVNINSFETQTMGDSIEIDWGDGTVYPMVSEPTNHIYDTSTVTSDVVTITIKGFIKSISGNATVPFIYKKILQNPSGSEPSYDERSIPLKNVTIEEAVGLQELGINTFKGSELSGKDLSFLPSTLETLGEGCFAECKLASLKGMPLNITAIPNNCFSSVATITSLEGMSPYVTSLGEAAFSGCSLLSSMNGMPSRITTIPPYCFSGTSLDSLDTLPSDVSTIGAYAFQSIPITSLSGLDADIVDIGDYAFYECNQLTDATALQNTRIAKLNKSFADCSNVETLTLPATITYIKADALTGVGAEKNVTEVNFLSKSISTITNITSAVGDSTFAWDLPNDDFDPGKTLIKGTDGTLLSVGDGTWELESTRSTFLLRGVAQNESATVELGIIETPSVARDSFRAAPKFMVDWGDGTINSSNAHTYAGSSTPEIETEYTISILGKVDSIAGKNNKPFITVNNEQSTPYLTSVEFGNAVGLKEIGDDAFVNCPNLAEVKGIYNTVTALGNRSFKGCYAFTNTDFLSRSSIAALPTECFASCTNLVSIDGLPDNSLSSIGDGCFSNCLNLVTLGSPKSVTYLGKNAFNKCLKITNVSSLVASVNTIAEGCFQNCGSLSEIGTLAHVTSIGARAFAGCPNISTLTLGSNATIGDNAFYEVATSESVATQKDEDYFNYKLLLDCSRSTYVEAAEMFGLQDGSIGDTRTGIDPLVTKIVCSDGILYYNQKENTRQWEISMPAIEIELQDVPNGTTFIVQTAGTRAYQGAALIWNWGDGTVEQWITDSPAEHTYINSGTSNYVIKVKGLLESISSLSEANGTYIRPKGSLENPYLVGYKIAESSPIKTIGRASFSRCPKLKNIDTLNLPKPRSPTKLQKRDASKSRLEQLSNEYSANKGRVGYEAYVFYKSGIQDMSGLPDNLGVLSEGLFQDTKVTDLSSLHDNVTDMEDSVFRDNAKLQRLYGFPSKVGYISNYAFANCTNLETLTDLKSVPLTTIGEGAFAGNTSLQNLKGISNSVTSVGPVAFGGSGIFDFNDLSTAVTNIGDGAFMMCLSLTNGVISKEVVAIGDNVFKDAGRLTIPYEDELGLSPYLRVKVNMDCDEWLSVLQRSTNDNPLVQFICNDGYVVNNSHQWLPMYKSVDIAMQSVFMGDNFHLGKIESLSNTPIIVKWGDGTEEQYYEGLSHSYRTNGNYTVTIVGFITSMSCSSNDYPIISKNGQGNPHIYHVSIGEAVGNITLGDYCFKGSTVLKSLQGEQYTKRAGLKWSKCGYLGKECFANCTMLSSLEGLPDMVSGFGEGCFSNCVSLSSVANIPSLVTELPPFCFAGCSALKGIGELNHSIIEFNNGCFSGCTGLSSLDGMVSSASLGADTTNSITFGPYVFAGCTALTNLVGFGGSELSEGMFSGCTGLLSLHGIPSRITTIPNACFQNCIGITSLQGYCDSVTDIGESAFQGCVNLQSLKGLSSVVSINAYAFQKCSALIDLDGLTTNLLEIGAYAFSSNNNLLGFGPLSASDGISSPDAHFSVGTYAFLDCPKFGALSSTFRNLPEGITFLGQGAFMGCNMSGCYSLPFLVTELPDLVFAATALSNITINAATLSVISSNSFADAKTHIFQYASLPTDRVISFTNITPKVLAQIPQFPFGNNTHTRFITDEGIVVWHSDHWAELPNSIIIDGVISSYNNEIRLSELFPISPDGYSVSWGDDDWEYWCSSKSVLSHTYTQVGPIKIKIYGPIQSINTPLSQTSFITTQGITITNITFTQASEIETFNSCSFKGLIGLTSLPDIPSSLKEIGAYCFENCSGIKSLLSLSSSISVIKEGAFKNCNAATNASIPQLSSLSIPSSLFQNCSALETVLFSGGSSITEIGDSVFEGCLMLSNININIFQHLQSIGNNSFKNCTSLNTLILPSSIERIGNNAFANIGISLPDQSDDSLNLPSYVFSSTIKSPFGVDKTFRLEGFPWGATEKVNFSCIDGNIIYLENEWKKYIGNSYFMVYIDPLRISNPVFLSFFSDSITNMIVWEEGQITTNINSNPLEPISVSHVFATPGIHTIGVRGNISKIGSIGNNSTTMPPIYANINSEIVTDFIYNIGLANNTSSIEIAPAAFSGFSMLQYCFMSAVSEIGEEAFEGCTNLVALSLPSTIKHIGHKAFKNCMSLEEISLYGDSSLSIGNNILQNCPASCQVKILGTEWPNMTTNSLSGLSFVSPSNTLMQFCIDASSVSVGKIMPNLSSSEIGTSFFHAWGLPHDSDKVIISTFDGTIKYSDTYTKWVCPRPYIEIGITNIHGGETLELVEPGWYMIDLQSDEKIHKVAIDMWKKPTTTPSGILTSPIPENITCLSPNNSIEILQVDNVEGWWGYRRVFYDPPRDGPFGKVREGQIKHWFPNSNYGRPIFMANNVDLKLMTIVSSSPQKVSGWPWAGRKGDSIPIEITLIDGKGIRASTTTSYAQYYGSFPMLPEIPYLKMRIKGSLAQLNGIAGFSLIKSPASAKVTDIMIGGGTGIKTVDSNVFSCSSITNVYISPLLESFSLPEKAFYGSGISSIPTMPAITKIPDFCFVGCSKLTSLDGLPRSIQEIGNFAFAAKLPDYAIQVHTGEYIIRPNSETILWPFHDAYGEYTVVRGGVGTTSPGNILYPHIPIPTTQISDISHLSNLTNLHSLGVGSFCGNPIVNLPSSMGKVTSIPAMCFQETKINTLNLPNTITSLEGASFDFCPIKDFRSMPSSITSITGTIATNAYNQNSMTYDVLHRVGLSCAFINMPELTSIDGLSPNIHSLTGLGFLHTKLPRSILLPNTIKTISPYVFLEQQYIGTQLDCNDLKVVQGDNRWQLDIDWYKVGVSGARFSAKKNILCSDGVKYTDIGGGGANFGQYSSYPKLTVTFKNPIRSGDNLIISPLLSLNGNLFNGDVNEARYDYCPLIIDWGDGTSTAHLPDTSGIFKDITHRYTSDISHGTITFIGYIQQILKADNNTYFITKIDNNGNSTSSPLSSFIFTDRLALNQIKPNLYTDTIQCVPTRELPERSDASYRAYTRNALKLLSGYPWGNNKMTCSGIETAYGGYHSSVYYNIKEKTFYSVPQSPSGVLYIYSSAGQDRLYPDNQTFRRYGNFDGEFYIRGPGKGEIATFKTGYNPQPSRQPSPRNTNVGSHSSKPEPILSIKGALSGIYPYPIEVNELDSPITDNLFKNFYGLTNMPPILEGKEFIGKSAFEGTRIKDFGVIPSSITNIGEKAFASLEWQDYHVEIQSSITNLTIGKEAFGDIYPFGITKKVVEFPNIKVQDLVRMPNFPFATMYDTGRTAFDKPHSNYTNDFNVYRCKGGVEVKPVNVGTEGDVEWVWMW